MTTQADYEQFTARVKDELGKRLEWYSLRLDDAALVGTEAGYVFVGWASNPISREASQFSLPFSADNLDGGTDVDALVDKLAGQVREYFYTPRIVVAR